MCAAWLANPHHKIAMGPKAKGACAKSLPALRNMPQPDAFLPHASNENLANKLRFEVRSLPACAKAWRCTLLIAAKNAQEYPHPIETESDARQVEGVGSAVAKVLVKYGLKSSADKRAHELVEGANVGMPKRARHNPLTADAASAAQQKDNAMIARKLRALADNRPGDDVTRSAIRRAAREIERWPKKLETIRQCFAVPKVSMFIAKIIITEVLDRGLTDDEQSLAARIQNFRSTHEHI